MIKAIRRLTKLAASVKTYDDFEKEVLGSVGWYLRDSGDTNIKNWKKTHLKQFYDLIKGDLPETTIDEIL
jgi:hypothetical protein